MPPPAAPSSAVASAPDDLAAVATASTSAEELGLVTADLRRVSLAVPVPGLLRAPSSDGSVGAGRPSFVSPRALKSPRGSTDGAKTRMLALIEVFAGHADKITKAQFLALLTRHGILQSDPRVAQTMEYLATYGPNEAIYVHEFAGIVRENSIFIERVLQGSFVVGAFKDFAKEILGIYKETARNTAGKVATYIPQLGRVDPAKWGLAITTIDGQQMALGDADEGFCVQSVSKPINYCIALDELGEDKVHQHIGHEPSGHGFNNLSLNRDNKPHNPMINAGAIMCCSLIKRGVPAADRFDYVMGVWNDLAGSEAKFDNAVYLSERATADRNFALAYFMREHGAFPEGTDLLDVLEFYFQCCSIEATARQLSVVAATLASGGVNPYTGKRVFKQSTVKNCLSLMYSCGMYDFSGEFAFLVGLPAKSGVSGVLMIVVPNVMGIAVWSPRLDAMGNSVRGVEFCRRLVKHFNFHNYDCMDGSNKSDPRRAAQYDHANLVGRLLWAAQQGDLTAIQHHLAQGVGVNDADYDGRTALHMAACEGWLNIAQLLVERGGDVNARDRWGHTPLSEAQTAGNDDIVAYLCASGAKEE